MGSASEEATCTHPSDSKAEVCASEFEANKGRGSGFRGDCVGKVGTPTAHCVYTPAFQINQGTTTEATPVESNMATMVAMGIGGVLLFVVALAVAVRLDRGRVQQRGGSGSSSYKELSKEQQQEEDDDERHHNDNGTGTRSGAAELRGGSFAASC